MRPPKRPKLMKLKFHGVEYSFKDDMRTDMVEREIREREWNVKKDQIVMDIGAGVGSYTIPAGLMGPKIVYAFEPDLYKFDRLIKNVERNHLSNIHPISVAMSSVEAVFPFCSTIGSINFKRDFEFDTNTVATTIDKFVDRQKVERLDWLKIDVEGAEYEVLRGGIDSIKRFGPHILLETHPECVEHLHIYLKGFLGDLGYQILNYELNANQRFFICSFNK
jgi:FkbM family methyltransferase